MSARSRRTERELRLPDGFSIRRVSNSHWAVIDADGEPLRKRSGMPVHVAFSGCQKSLRDARSTIQAALSARAAR